MRGHLGPWDLGLNKLGKGPPGNATYHISAPELSSSGEEDFEVYFIFEPKTPPRRRAISDPRATIGTILVEVH